MNASDTQLIAALICVAFCGAIVFRSLYRFWAGLANATRDGRTDAGMHCSGCAMACHRNSSSSVPVIEIGSIGRLGSSQR